VFLLRVDQPLAYEGTPVEESQKWRT
jgi:hypothetical protein